MENSNNNSNNNPDNHSDSNSNKKWVKPVIGVAAGVLVLVCLIVLVLWTNGSDEAVEPGVSDGSTESTASQDVNVSGSSDVSGGVDSSDVSGPASSGAPTDSSGGSSSTGSSSEPIIPDVVYDPREGIPSIGLRWGMSLQETLDTLGLTKDDVSISDGPLWTVGYTPEDEWFGVKPEVVRFLFIGDGNDRLEGDHLEEITLYYRGREQSQTDTIRRGLSELYASPPEGKISIGLSANSIQTLHEEDKIPLSEYATNTETESWWVSSNNLYELIQSDPAREKVYRDHYIASSARWENDENWKKGMEMIPVARIHLDATGDNAINKSPQWGDDGCTVLDFFGDDYVGWLAAK